MSNSEGINEQGIGDEQQVIALPSGIPDESAGAFDTTDVIVSTPTGTPLEEIEGTDISESSASGGAGSEGGGSAAGGSAAGGIEEDVRLDDEPLFAPDDSDV